MNGYCGNGIIEPRANEVCDDGNLNNGDGCSSDCECDNAWTVVQPTCKTTCGYKGATVYGSVSCSGDCCPAPTPAVPSKYCPATSACPVTSSCGSWTDVRRCDFSQEFGSGLYTSMSACYNRCVSEKKLCCEWHVSGHCLYGNGGDHSKKVGDYTMLCSYNTPSKVTPPGTTAPSNCQDFSGSPGSTDPCLSGSQNCDCINGCESSEGSCPSTGTGDACYYAGSCHDQPPECGDCL